MAALWQMVTEFVLAHFGGNLPDVVLEVCRLCELIQDALLKIFNRIKKH